EPYLVEKLSGLQVAQTAAESSLRDFGDRLKKRERYVLADDGGGLEKPLVLGGEPVDARGQDRLSSRWNLQHGRRPRQMVSTSLARKGPRLDQCPDALLEEEGIALGPLDQQLLERLKTRGISEQGLQQLDRTLRREGIDAELPVVHLAPPNV